MLTKEEIEQEGWTPSPSYLEYRLPFHKGNYLMAYDTVQKICHVVLKDPSTPESYLLFGEMPERFRCILPIYNLEEFRMLCKLLRTTSY